MGEGGGPDMQMNKLTTLPFIDILNTVLESMMFLQVSNVMSFIVI